MSEVWSIAGIVISATSVIQTALAVVTTLAIRRPLSWLGRLLLPPPSPLAPVTLDDDTMRKLARSAYLLEVIATNTTNLVTGRDQAWFEEELMRQAVAAGILP